MNVDREAKYINKEVIVIKAEIGRASCRERV